LWPLEASHKRQATRGKPQEASHKRQATRGRFHPGWPTHPGRPGEQSRRRHRTVGLAHKRPQRQAGRRVLAAAVVQPGLVGVEVVGARLPVLPCGVRGRGEGWWGWWVQPGLGRIGICVRAPCDSPMVGGQGGRGASGLQPLHHVHACGLGLATIKTEGGDLLPPATAPPWRPHPRGGIPLLMYGSRADPAGVE
jgi:hypothetical protein